MTQGEPKSGPLQILLVGFETTERFRGEVARELTELRGRGLIRVLDARAFFRGEDGKLTEVDLNPMLADRPAEYGNPLERLLATNGANGGGNGGHSPQEAFSRTAGFALEDLRRLAAEIGPGEHAVAILVEHVWAAHLRESVHDAGARLVGQGLLTPEVSMLIGSEIEARREAEAAIELATAARGAALIDALATLAARQRPPLQATTQAAAAVIRVLLDQGFIHEAEAGAAVEALATAGLMEAAMIEAAAAEAEDALPGHD